ncbi:hypothetical protein OCA5_pOC16701350 (plasmid) [Afipia carboxidovorans OM5]|uniref:Uncharacterized protein n=1 Tax=Afipia carboxidovorans (strain ATCC 49405 / DSM 1227 / KCTC 32145 / OM5) TaxID=504832 RepID=F8C1L6_AFIC5|nr:hypothetical protein OCA4_pOC167B01350 [Afipia carboxidovorans OM4]AEI08331.1 hypothetical protein OCA5_pOC16701350 [Afipia carboxidovorans OM5]
MFAGAYRRHKPLRESFVPNVTEAQEGSLEARTIAAHRAYLDALVAWELAVHQAACPICRPEQMSEDEHSRCCDTAEAEKERCRIAFRDLCQELGFVPTGHGIKLPPESRLRCAGWRAN